MYLLASVALAFVLSVVALGSTEASARGRSNPPKVVRTSNVAPTAKSHSPALKRKAAALAVADLAPFRYQASWKNSRF